MAPNRPSSMVHRQWLPSNRASLLGLFLTLSSALIEAGELEATVLLTPQLASRISFETVGMTPYGEVIRLPGRVTLDEHRVARIGPSISGRVVEVRAFTGRQVKKGDVLAVLNSTELSHAQADYLKAETQIGLQRLTAERARRLYREGIISEVTLREREAAFEEAQVEIHALADQLGVMGMTRDTIHKLQHHGHIDSTTRLSTTISGTVIERKISVGQIVEISDELFTVADLSSVWIAAEAPELDAHLVLVGSRVEARIPALPNERFVGQIVFVADTVKPETRTVTVRMEVDNSHRRLKPEMLADMMITRTSESALTIPAQAVLRVGDHDQVFVQDAKDRVALRPVRLGETRAGRRQVLEGLVAGDVIVVDGAFHLNNVRTLKDLE